jgi:hypothetical protein
MTLSLENLENNISTKKATKQVAYSSSFTSDLKQPKGKK